MASNPCHQVLPPFEEMVDLAQKDPEAFAQFKRDMCEEMIQSASNKMQQRLWAQQSHIDLVVSKCKNPDHTNVTLMRELSEQMAKFKGALDGEVEKQGQAEIIPFHQTGNLH
ncbi:DUF3135 domain-containing protein [Vibrio sp. CAIM 722]|uniref:DUF3135 domain-containing protein n=1 Tax=Vibrio eleionomae TaxID=2653505 RepID=A0A7X4LHX3_9VIBR|nr:DUF3135 domain-containing protein [Vibrio eleionomae]MZI92268.1 DUF3135 domain-containing protein [Vibrio eleionomae]